MTTTVKVYHIKGNYQKGKKRIPFGKYVRALNAEDALTDVFSDIGSRHNVKRIHINVKPENIVEIEDYETIKDITVKAFTTEELKFPKKK